MLSDITRRGAKRLCLAVVLILLLVSAACCADDSTPKNIILIIGDGMGIGQITAARCAGPGPYGKLTLDTMPITGLSITHPQGCLVTDSAAAGTALSCGHKTRNGMIAMLEGDRPVPSIRELAQEAGKATGVVTTDSVTGATPSVFLAHVPNRGQKHEIAAQIIDCEADVIMGGGLADFLPNTVEGGARDDNRDLVAEAKKHGYRVMLSRADLEDPTPRKVLGLFNTGGLGYDQSQPTTAELTSKAVSVLSKDPDGFFLVVEESRIDGAGHGNKADDVVKGVLALDEALAEALEFARADGQTLVVVTADHETGGMAIQNADDQHPDFTAQWTGGGHSANMVAIYGFGPGSEKLSGTHQNTDIPKILAGLWNLEL